MEFQEIRLMSLFDNHGIVERASIYKDTHGLLMENQLFPFVSCKKRQTRFRFASKYSLLSAGNDRLSNNGFAAKK